MLLSELYLATASDCGLIELLRHREEAESRGVPGYDSRDLVRIRSVLAKRKVVIPGAPAHSVGK